MKLSRLFLLIVFAYSLTLNPGIAQDEGPLFGKWKNSNPTSRWHGKVEFVKEKDDSIVMWLYGTPGKKRTAKADLTSDADYFYLKKPGKIVFGADHGFKTDSYEFELIRGSILRVKATSVYTDDSGRKPISVVEEFTRDKE